MRTGRHASTGRARPIVLASASPRRAQLLTSAGIDFRAVPSGVDERPPQPLGPLAYVRWAARQKAEAVARRFPRRVVVGADTEVVLDRRIFGKPQDPKQAREFLAALNGRTHQVYTAVQVINGQTACSASGFSRTDVTMREVSGRMIASYARSDEAQDKAGAYAIQGEGRRLVQAIRGPYDNVVGMPVRLLIRLLAECGVPVPAKHPDAAQHPVPAKARRSNPGMRRRSPSC